MGCSEWCREEFKPSNFGLGHPRPELTVTSQWRWPPILYVCWRWFAALYQVTWLIVSVAAAEIYFAGRYTWLIYLTNWAYLLLSVDLVCEAGASLAWYIRQRNPNSHPPRTTTWYMKLGWLMYEMTTAVSLLVGLLYWILLYSPGGQEFYIDLQTHGITILYVVLNLAITAMPVRIYHLVYPMLFSVIYLIFTTIYYYAGGVNLSGRVYIYKGILDWSDPGTSIKWALIIVLVAVPVVHVLLVYGLHLIRVLIHKYCCGGCVETQLGNNSSTELNSSSKLQRENRVTYDAA